jgi:hypothetical protein
MLMNIVIAMDSFDLSCLTDAAALVDAKLDLLDERAKQSFDPDALGIYDRAEYLAGFGLVACQTYITEAIAMSGLARDQAFNLGARHECGHSMATLINAVANYWKHEPEWSQPLSRRAQATADLIASLSVDIDASYVVVNALYELVRPEKPRVRHLIPILAQWRQALHKNS